MKGNLWTKRPDCSGMARIDRYHSHLHVLAPLRSFSGLDGTSSRTSVGRGRKDDGELRRIWSILNGGAVSSRKKSTVTHATYWAGGTSTGAGPRFLSPSLSVPALDPRLSYHPFDLIPWVSYSVRVAFQLSRVLLFRTVLSRQERH